MPPSQGALSERATLDHPRAGARLPDTPPAWFVYVLWSERLGRTYVGITTEPERRLAQHNGERAGGARATRGGRPWALGAVFGPYPDRGAATREELRVKARRGRARMEPEAG